MRRNFWGRSSGGGEQRSPWTTPGIGDGRGLDDPFGYNSTMGRDRYTEEERKQVNEVSDAQKLKKKIVTDTEYKKLNDELHHMMSGLQTNFSRLQ